MSDWRRVPRAGVAMMDAYAEDGREAQSLVWKSSGVGRGRMNWNARVTRYSPKLGRNISIEVIAMSRAEAEGLAEDIKGLAL